MPFEAADLERIREMIRLMDEHGLVELSIEHGQDKIYLKRPGPQPVPIQPIAPTTAPASPAGLLEIKAPLVGTFYRATRPDADPYVEVGSRVEPKTVVCIIEAMKVLNEIKAELTGTIVEVLATNGQPVEYGQPLFRVRPD
ncbi:MAG: hypothetical protein QHH07_04535 [Sedimentisphaerales bacterium]|jgi:acetyl-CoA carboxylase biotin carboxyl carrier protein|nr:hypothetical protein [Sedimentisphaerales bacterium]